jgi:hypothetical protein
VVLRHQDGALDDVVQLAHVALPGIVEKSLHRGGIEALRHLR